MEQNQPDSFLELQVDHESKSYLRETARWTNFISIIFFIVFGFFLLIMLILGGVFLSGGLNTLDFPTDEISGPALPGLMVLQFIQFILIFVFLLYSGTMLYRFGVRCRRAIENQDQLSFNTALRSLRNYFVTSGIIAIFGVIVDLLNFTKLF